MNGVQVPRSGYRRSVSCKQMYSYCRLCRQDRNYNKILMETGKFMDNIRVTKNGLVSGVDRMFKSSDSAFNHIPNQPSNIILYTTHSIVSGKKRSAGDRPRSVRPKKKLTSLEKCIIHITTRRERFLPVIILMLC